MRRPLILILVTHLLSGCSSASGPADSGPIADGGSGDAGSGDAGSGDAGGADAGGGDGGDGGDAGGSGDGGFQILPASVTLSVAPGGAAATQAFQALEGAQDVTTLATFTLSDPSLGAMSGGRYTSATDRGGAGQVTATYQGQTAPAALTLIVREVIDAGCGSCRSIPSAACSGGVGAAALIYPPDGVLVPPNLGSLDVQWRPGAGTSFEVQLVNAVTDLRTETPCIAPPSGDATGCHLLLDGEAWALLARTNRGGDPVSVSIRSTDAAAACYWTSGSARVTVAPNVLGDALTYWRADLSPTATAHRGIWVNALGADAGETQIQLTGPSGPDPSSSCVGCHAISRDGQRLFAGVQDNDSDDRYVDVPSGLADLHGGLFLSPGGSALRQAPGFATFSHDHALYLSTSGNGSGAAQFGGAGGPANVLFAWNGTDGTAASNPSVTVGAAGSRPTQPDWAPDDSSVVLVVPAQAGVPTLALGDDTHVFGGSLWLLPYQGAGKFGPASQLVPSQGENNYYPAFAPDGRSIAFNRVPHDTSGATVDACDAGLCPNDSFANPAARILITPVASNAPVDCTQANGSAPAQPQPWANSWPRFAPSTQSVHGHAIAWVAFSSTRDYGLELQNQTGRHACYPAGSPQNPSASNGDPFPTDCLLPQIWIAAVDLATAGAGGGDPSFPAFWLPGQNLGSHHHSPEWSAPLPTSGLPDAGGCAQPGQDCMSLPCCGGLICGAGGTCITP